MSLQEIYGEKIFRRRVADYTVTGADGTQIVNGSNTTFVVTGAYAGTASTDEQYNPDMVAEILRADARPAEAKFNNVVDMLDWLNRD